MSLLHVFIGHDSRWPIATKVCEHTLRKHSTIPLAVTWLDQRVLPKREYDPKQSNEFTYLRFFIPWLMGYQGHALYVEQDMLVLDDVSWLARGPGFGALACVKHDYKPVAATKMHGAVQEAYPRKNWSSVMLMDCDKLRCWTPAVARKCDGAFLHRFAPLEDDEVGSLDARWNVLDYVTDDMGILHYTSGGPWHGQNATLDPKAAELWHYWRKDAGL